MFSTFMRMHGAKYDYKISYEDIGKLFLLPIPDGVSAAIVISLEKPIRQGNQTYSNLVLQSHRLEHTIQVLLLFNLCFLCVHCSSIQLNLTEKDIVEKYDNQLALEMTMSMCNLIAKIFKVLSQSKVFLLQNGCVGSFISLYVCQVFVPKLFKSFRDHQAVKCSLKRNDGLLYPLEKSIIFINKPTELIRYEDIEMCKFERYEFINSGNATARCNYNCLAAHEMLL